jgi:hypothetical protein
MNSERNRGVTGVMLGGPGHGDAQHPLQRRVVSPKLQEGQPAAAVPGIGT